MAIDIKTDRQAKTIAVPGRHGIGVPRANLKIQIRNGTPTRSYQWTPKGRPAITIGSPNSVSLKTARELGRRFNDQLASGLDPAAARRAAGQTFGKSAEACIESLRAGWDNPTTERGWRNVLTVHAAALRDKPVAAIGVDDVLAVLRPLWGRKSETADQLRRRIERVLDFARAKGDRHGDSSNPARWRGHLENILPQQEADVVHRPAMPYAEMPAFMARLAQQEGLPWRGLELLAFTATRYSAVQGAEWPEFDLGARLWTIPGARCKKRAGQPRRLHVVPLSPAALVILDRIPRSDDEPRLFASIGRERMRVAMATLGEAYVPHGLRSSFRDWGADRTDFPDSLLEECLDHFVGSSVRRAYRRGAQDFDKRRAVFEAWGRFLTAAAVGVPLKAVVS